MYFVGDYTKLRESPKFRFLSHIIILLGVVGVIGQDEAYEVCHPKARVFVLSSINGNG